MDIQYFSWLNRQILVGCRYNVQFQCLKWPYNPNFCHNRFIYGSKPVGNRTNFSKKICHDRQLSNKYAFRSFIYDHKRHWVPYTCLKTCLIYINHQSLFILWNTQYYRGFVYDKSDEDDTTDWCADDDDFCSCFGRGGVEPV